MWNVIIRVSSFISLVFGMVIASTKDFSQATYFIALAVYLESQANEEGK